jgi:hypothetical protein
MFGYKPPKAITVTTLSSTYEERHKQRFLDTYESSSDFNENMDKCFYNQAELRDMLIEENNGLEKTWKTRILFENTPRGNIIMYYDAFKQGFAYYCDQNSLPYHLLNAVAMKYVTTYRCRDFFVDNQETPENHPSPLLEPAKTTEVVLKKEESVGPKKPAPFAKFKSYNMVNSKVKEEEKKKKEEKKRKEGKEGKEEKEEKIYIRNKFICLGKIINFKLIQPVEKKRGFTFKSNLMESMKNDQSFQKSVMSYAEYKKLKSASTNSN